MSKGSGWHGSSEACAWCGWPTEPATGIYLELVAHGRTICSPCGRFQLFCECPINARVAFNSQQRSEVRGFPF